MCRVHTRVPFWPIYLTQGLPTKGEITGQATREAKAPYDRAAKCWRLGRDLGLHSAGTDPWKPSCSGSPKHYLRMSIIIPHNCTPYRPQCRFLNYQDRSTKLIMCPLLPRKVPLGVSEVILDKLKANGNYISCVRIASLLASMSPLTTFSPSVWQKCR